MKRFSSFTRQSFYVRNRAPWGKMLSHAIHQFHENDLFTSAAAMSYFGLLALFPALLLMLVAGNDRLLTANTRRGYNLYHPGAMGWFLGVFGN